MTPVYVPSHVPPESSHEPALWFAFREAELLVCAMPGEPMVPWCTDLREHGLQPQRAQYLGRYEGRPCYAAHIGNCSALPQGWEFKGLRDVFGLVETGLAAPTAS